MAEIQAGGVYLAADGKTRVDASGKKIAAAAAQANGGEGGGDKLPAVNKLAEHIAGMSAEEVTALQAKDERATAAAIYEARLAELSGE